MDIHILPSNIANMIAAGEVVQRPASVVKELMENAVDAGASKVSVIITDAGRTLIQVIDNGCGMSPDQAVLCFERHATSKIATADDLTKITTLGFRGEALASIAAVSEVTLQTRRAEDEVGCKVQFADSRHISTDGISTPVGANFAVRNLFYNIPARRKFLKSDNAELKHIVDEFTHVALTYPEIAFTLSHNGKDLFVLNQAKSLKARIMDLMGDRIAEQLVEIGADTAVVRIHGYIGQPDKARKTLGNQFFFVNGRYFRSAYFNKAVLNAYAEMLPQGATPSYFIYMETDPASIDVNIHPTKTEIKFEEDSVIFQILFACVKESLGKNSFGALIDFDRNDAPEMPIFSSNYDSFRSDIRQPQIGTDPDFNPFETGVTPPVPDFNATGTSGAPASSGFASYQTPHYVDKRDDYGALFEDKEVSQPSVIILQGKYIITTVKSGLLMINIRRAKERIYYERFLEALSHGKHVSQSALFPVQVVVGVDNRLIFDEHHDLLASLGFDITPFGNDTIVVNGMPEGFAVDQRSVETAMADILLIISDSHSSLPGLMESTMAEKFARMSASEGKNLTSVSEAHTLIETLLACANAEYTPSGHKTMTIMQAGDIEKIF